MKTLLEKIRGTLAVGETARLSDLARKFRVPRADIEDLTHQGVGLDLLVGIRVGSGIGELKKSEYEIERYE